MKKYLVIGNPIKHSLSPKLHNYWIKQNNIDAIYEKKKINEKDIRELILEIKKENLNGMNITVPFKKIVTSFLDDLTDAARKTQSVNTVFKREGKAIGDNTDIGGFEAGIKNTKYKIQNKKIFILGAGGVVPSIIFALRNLGVSEIILSNRTKKKSEDIKKLYPELKVLNWGEIPNFDIIINATSIGLKKKEKIELNLINIGKDKLFYDVIYNPSMTNFLIEGKKLGNKVENGKMMFIYQAQLAFKIWHNILPKIDEETISLLNT
ncbi:MAG: shikimate dehydrogenase [Pelagibacterales bacterium]|nr:shikimate dehydrogenase [Pelagibacterales bacterium]